MVDVNGQHNRQTLVDGQRSRDATLVMAKVGLPISERGPKPNKSIACAHSRSKSSNGLDLIGLVSCSVSGGPTFEVTESVHWRPWIVFYQFPVYKHLSRLEM